MYWNGLYQLYRKNEPAGKLYLKSVIAYGAGWADEQDAKNILRKIEGEECIISPKKFIFTPQEKHSIVGVVSGTVLWISYF